MGAMVAAGSQVYRPVLGRVLTACYAAFAGWWVIAALTSGGRAVVSGTALAWLLLAGATMYALLWRPAVIVDPDGVLLLNIVRQVWVPWAVLEAVETRYALTLVAAGRRYASWAAGAPGRGRALVGRGSGPAAGGQAAADASPGEREGGEAASSRHLPRRGWLPGAVNLDRSSRDLRTDSGAAAFLVEQAWLGWRERPPARPGDDAPVPAVGVRWNLPVVAGLPLLLAIALTCQTLGV